MYEVIEKLPEDNDICMIRLNAFSGILVEAVYNASNQEFVLIESGLISNANLVYEWKLKSN